MNTHKPAHLRFRLNPPHGDSIHWVAQGPFPGDSRSEHISVRRKWFWRYQEEVTS